MKLKIKIFGLLQEITQEEELILTMDEHPNPAQITEKIKTMFPEMQLIQIKLAVNQKFDPDTICKAEDELALLPPFAGG